ncbi:MAG: FkbM family methyltransferase [Fimbriimonadaceae bacterium]|nr:FkbM family methyltransferase [Alphaproteobacteria bacterium]
MFRDRYYSLGSTIDPQTAELMGSNIDLEQLSVRARTLNSILRDTPHADNEIDLLTIDCEGHDLNVL